MSLREGTPSGNNGLPVLRAMGHPVLFDGFTSKFNLGVANKWVTLFDLTSYTDRIFAGISIFNSDAVIPLYIAFEQVIGSEAKSLIIEPSSVMSIDEMTFGPGWRDKWTLKKANYVRAMVQTASGTPAAATATYAVNPPDLSQIVIGVNTYTIKAAPGSGLFDVARGASLAATLTNLIAVINADDANVTATASATVLTVTSRFSGTGMNSYVFVDGSPATGGTFTGTGTLGGAGATAGAGGILVDSIVW